MQNKQRSAVDLKSFKLCGRDFKKGLPCMKLMKGTCRRPVICRQPLSIINSLLRYAV